MSDPCRMQKSDVRLFLIYFCQNGLKMRHLILLYGNMQRYLNLQTIQFSMDGRSQAGFVWACASVWCGLSQGNDHTNGRPGPAHRQIISVGRIGGISAGEAIMAPQNPQGLVTFLHLQNQAQKENI